MTIHELSALERASIRRFVEQAAADGLLSDLVLDYGCGRQPYRDVVEAAGGQYVPWDRADLPGGSVGDVGPDAPLRDFHWDAVLSTQVIEYVPDPYRMLRDMRDAVVAPGGALVMTYPTCWPELPGDLCRYTKLGMDRLLRAAGWTIVRHEMRESIKFDGFELPLGYGAVCRA